MVKSAPAQHLLTVQEKKREREAIEKNKESNLEKVLSSCTWIVRCDVAKVHDKCWQWRMKERLPDGGWVFITFLEQSVDNLDRAEKHAREKLRKIHFRTNYRFFHRSRSFTREIIDSRRNINNHPAGQIVQFLARRHAQSAGSMIINLSCSIETKTVAKWRSIPCYWYTTNE